MNSMLETPSLQGKSGGEIPRLRKPTPSQERRRKKKRRLASLGMTVGCSAANGREMKIKRPRLKIEPGAPGHPPVKRSATAQYRGSKLASSEAEWSQIYPLGALLLVRVGVAIADGACVLGLGDVGIDSGGGRMHLAKLLWRR
jgi:hypothetical protein